MSCNGCKILRKGCSEGCVLRQCLTCIGPAEAQQRATLFLTKSFGRAGLADFINGVPHCQRPALFQSLLYEACGRAVNPIYGAVGLLFTGNWSVCQKAVDTVLRGGKLEEINVPWPQKTTALRTPADCPPPNIDLEAVAKSEPAADTYIDHELQPPIDYNRSSRASSCRTRTKESPPHIIRQDWHRQEDEEEDDDETNCKRSGTTNASDDSRFVKESEIISSLQGKRPRQDAAVAQQGQNRRGEDLEGMVRRRRKTAITRWTWRSRSREDVVKEAETTIGAAEVNVVDDSSMKKISATNYGGCNYSTVGRRCTQQQQSSLTLTKNMGKHEFEGTDIHHHRVNEFPLFSSTNSRVCSTANQHIRDHELIISIATADAAGLPSTSTTTNCRSDKIYSSVNLPTMSSNNIKHRKHRSSCNSVDYVEQMMDQSTSSSSHYSVQSAGSNASVYIVPDQNQCYTSPGSAEPKLLDLLF